MKKKNYKSAKPFFEKLLQDPEIRIRFEEEKVRSEIAFIVKSARKTVGLTQTELAERVGTSQSVIARLEGGNDRRIPSLLLLAKIALSCDATLEFGFAFKKAG